MILWNKKTPRRAEPVLCGIEKKPIKPNVSSSFHCFLLPCLSSTLVPLACSCLLHFQEIRKPKRKKLPPYPLVREISLHLKFANSFEPTIESMSGVYGYFRVTAQGSRPDDLAPIHHVRHPPSNGKDVCTGSESAEQCGFREESARESSRKTRSLIRTPMALW